MKRKKQSMQDRNVVEDQSAVVSCLYLGDDEQIAASIKAFYSQRGYRFKVLRVTSAGEAKNVIANNKVSFVLAYVSDPAVAGTSLSSQFSLTYVWSPPLVVIVDKDATPHEIELFRQQGAILLMSKPDSRMVPEAELVSLVKGEACQYRPTSLLKILWASVKGKGRIMLSVISDVGWYGRIYIDNGMLIHAETADNVGLEALVELIPIPNTWCQEHRVFLTPSESMTCIPLNEAIFRAMGKLDEQGDWSSGFSYAGKSIDVTRGFVSSTFLVGAKRKSGESAKKTVVVTKSSVASVPEEEGNDNLIKFPGAMPVKDQKGVAHKIDEVNQIEETSMSQLGNILNAGDNVSGVVCSDLNGNVVEEHGDIDGQTAAAVALLGKDHIAEIGNLLGFGEVREWVSVSENSSIYVLNVQEVLVTAVGSKVNAPLLSLAKLVKGSNG